MQDLQLHEWPQIVPILTARSLVECLASDSDRCANALAERGPGGLMMWAPSDKDALERVLHGFSRPAPAVWAVR